MIHLPDFAHHTIDLLSLPGAAGAFGGKAHLAAVKAACKSAERINGALVMAGRVETAIIPGEPDFFSDASGLGKVKRLVWDAIRDSTRLRWIVLGTQAETFRKALPDDWPTNGYPNVCVGLALDLLDDLSEKAQQLRAIPARWRMLLFSSLHESIDLCGKVDGIDWVVAAGIIDDAQRANPIKEACKTAGAAFHFHRCDCGACPENPQEDSSSDPADNDEPAWPNHPFGNQVHLDLPTLPALRKEHEPIYVPTPPPAADADIQPNDSIMRTPPTDPAPTDPSPAEPAMEPPAPPLDAPQEMPAVSAMAAAEPLALEVVQSTADGDKPAVLGADCTDFEHLDKVVRDGLKTFIDVGNALLEISKRELWRAGGHANWAAYCQDVGGLTKSHANRLIKSSIAGSNLSQVTPIGVTAPWPAPRAESQVRPLSRLSDAEQQAAWSSAVELAGGQQPTAKIVSAVVAKMLGGKSRPGKSEPNSKQLLVETFSRLRSLVLSKKPSKDIEALISEIERLIKLT